MTRAELRRKQREKEKSTSTYTLTVEQIENIKKDIYTKAVRDVLVMMLAIPCEVLSNDYWKKSAKQKLPKFVEECLSLYRSYEQGIVTMEEMEQDLWELAGYKVENKKP